MPTEEEMNQAVECHEQIMAAARARWPDMVEHPHIVNASPGCNSLVAPFLSKSGEEWARKSIKERWTESDDWYAWREERIDLEQVGPYQLGYGPESCILYVGVSPS
jgi:hypothetical protein